MQTMAARIYK